MTTTEIAEILIHGGIICRKDLPTNPKILILHLQDIKYNINACLKQINKLIKEEANGMDNR